MREREIKKYQRTHCLLICLCKFVRCLHCSAPWRSEAHAVQPRLLCLPAFCWVEPMGVIGRRSAGKRRELWEMYSTSSLLWHERSDRMRPLSTCTQPMYVLCAAATALTVLPRSNFFFSFLFRARKWSSLYDIGVQVPNVHYFFFDSDFCSLNPTYNSVQSNFIKFSSDSHLCFLPGLWMTNQHSPHRYRLYYNCSSAAVTTATQGHRQLQWVRRSPHERK